MATTDAGAVGDPHITRLDGVKFDFIGKPNATYNLLTHGGLQVHAAVSGSGKAWHWVNIKSRGETSILFDEKDIKRTDAGDWRIDVHRLNLKGSGEPHCNIHVLEAPNDLTGATGLLVDGVADAGDSFMIKPPPAPQVSTA